MFGTIYTGLSGLNAYSRGLQQVSNNVTNLNTAGFKASTVSFTDLYATGSRGNLSGNGAGRGTGQGVNLGLPQIDFKQGDMRQTGRDLDLAIQGTGFLVLLDGKQTLYARTGSFEVDKDGYVVMVGTNYRLATLDDAGRAVTLSIDSRRTNPPEATTKVTFNDNLSSTATSHTVSDIRVYDQNGAEYVWQARFTKPTATATDWTVEVTRGGGGTVGTATLKLIGGIVDPTTRTLTFTDAASGLSVDFDFSEGVSSYSSGEVSGLRKASVDGRAAGAINSVTVNKSGHLELGYSNGQTSDLGAIAIADFRVPQSLEQRGGGLFAAAAGYQPDLVGNDAPMTGNVVAGQLEASNVDLSQQFGDLILIQRGFQASSQIVSVSNDMIQQLFGIRGQG